MQKKSSMNQYAQDLRVWKFILQALKDNEKTILLLVLESTGSSPGRQGFKMAVSLQAMEGSVGGGIMEHKFVELAKEMLRNEASMSIIKKQIHSKNAPENQSGMICSGEQTLAIIPMVTEMEADILKLINALNNHESGYLFVEAASIQYIKNYAKPTGLNLQEDKPWFYAEKIGIKNKLFIVGGGHVSLAFSKLMKDLDFEIYVFDHRPNLNTLENNAYADHKKVVDFEHIANEIPDGDQHFVVIMSFGYRTDKQALTKLMDKKFAYLGLLGSKAKIEHLWNELRAEGFSENQLNRVFAPVGLPIKSQTPAEIAVSIAAQIIAVQNKNL